MTRNTLVKSKVTLQQERERLLLSILTLSQLSGVSRQIIRGIEEDQNPMNKRTARDLLRALNATRREYGELPLSPDDMDWTVM